MSARDYVTGPTGGPVSLKSPDGSHVTLEADPDIERFGLLSWESQSEQYPLLGKKGCISYFAGEVPGYAKPVDCLLFRDSGGYVRGILNYYPIDFPPFEEAGNLMVMVAPRQQGKGIGSALLDEADRRWGPLDLAQQKYSRTGLVLVASWLRRRGWTVEA